ncbi:MAG: hypothetical protein NVS9B10_08360 [Nevskia sp.]
MFDYAKYLLSPVLISISACGLLLGGVQVWLGLGVLLGVLFFDAFLEPDHSVRDPRFPWLYDLVVSFTVASGAALLLLYVHLVAIGHFLTTASAVGAFLTMMFTQFVVTAPCIHELFHRENLVLRWYGRLGQVLIFDPWREITHVVTHHLHVGTPTDPDYARRGDTVYGHLYRTMRDQIRESYHLEKMMWTKRGRAWYDPRNGWVWRASALVGFSLVLFAVGGLKGMLLGIAVCLCGPRLLLEVFNYTQHYGLICATPGGQFSDWLYSEDRRGIRIWLEGPFGMMGIDDPDIDGLCIAGGTGLAPVLSIVEDRLRRSARAKFTIVFGVRNSNEIFCRDRLDALVASAPERVRVVVIASNEAQHNGWRGARGLVTEALTPALGIDFASTGAFICGSLPMVEAVEAKLLGLGLTPDRIHADKFLPSAY